MGRKNVFPGIGFFLVLLGAVACALIPVFGANPGTPAADSALSYDPFKATATPAASGSSAATATAGNAVQAAPSANTNPRTPVCPPTNCVCVNNAPIAVQSSSSNTTQTFTVSLSANPTAPITVHYATSDGPNGIAGVDYVAKSGTLTFNPGVTSLPVTVTILRNSSTAGTSEQYYLNLTSATGATIVCTKGIGEIQPPVIYVATSNPPPVDQSTAAHVLATFNVTLSAPSSTPVTVKYTTVPGTALPNVDYQPVTGTLTFPPGVTSLPVKVWILPGSSKINREFYLNVSNPTGAPGLTVKNPTATQVIVGQNSENVAGLSVNDVYVMQSKTSSTTGQFTVTLSTGSSKPVTVHYVTEDVTGGAVAGVDYLPISGNLTFPPGVTTETVPFTVLPGNLTSNKIFKLILSNPVNAPIYRGTGVATIIPPMVGISVSDAPPDYQSGLHSTTSTFTVTLSGLSSMHVTVEYYTSNGTGVAGTDYIAKSGVLTFTPDTLVQTVTVTIPPGSNPNNRNFYLNISNPSPGVTITRPQGVGPILGHQCGCISLSVNDITVKQSASAKGTAIFTVSLTNKASVPVTVTYTTANGPNPGEGGGAQAGEDYVATTGTLTFPVGVTSLPVPVTILPENESYNEHFTLNLSNPSGAVISKGTGTCQIIPTMINVAVADAAPVHRSPSATSYAVFNVTLSSISNSPVTVKYTTADGTAIHGVDYQQTSGTITFPPLTQTQTVQVPVLPGTQNTDKTFTLDLSNATGTGVTITRPVGTALIYAQLVVPLPVITVNNISVLQSKTVKVPATFTISLSAASSKPVTVNYTTVSGTHPGAGGGATAGEDFVAVSGTATFAPGKTSFPVPVMIIPESENYAESFTLNLSSASGATIATAQGTCLIIPPTIDVSVYAPAQVQRSATADTNVTFTISLSSVSNSAITVEYETADGTAVQNHDYLPASGTVTFSPGKTVMTVTVKALPGGGSTVKTFNLNLMDAVGPGAVLATPKATAQIKG